MTFDFYFVQDFAIQQLERRINRMQGEQSNEEKLHLEAKIKEFTEELDQKTATHHLISLQLKRLQVSQLDMQITHKCGQCVVCIGILL